MKRIMILVGMGIGIGLYQSVSHAATDPAASYDSNYAAHKKWLIEIAPSVRTTAKKYNVYGSVEMAQAVLESNWGQSDLSVRANNFFGIKGDADGGHVFALTSEYNGATQQVVKQVLNTKTKKLETVYKKDAKTGKYILDTKTGKKIPVYETVYKNVTYKTANEIGVSTKTTSVKDLNGVTRPVKNVTLIGGEYTQVLARFAKYKSFASSLAYNGNLIRSGLSWDPTYYSGAWKENTKSYKDATNALTGTYATDASYAVKLNQLIKDYGMDRLADTTYNKVTKKKAVNYRIMINEDARNDAIYYGGPYNTTAAATVRGANAKAYNKSAVNVIEESQTNSTNGVKWLKFKIGNQYVWMDSRGGKRLNEYTTKTKVNYPAKLTEAKRNDGLYWHGAYNVSSSTQTRNDDAKRYDGTKVTVVQEAKTNSTNGVTWVEFKLGNRLVWMDSRGIQKQ